MLDSDMLVRCCTLVPVETIGWFAIKRVRQLRIRVQLHNGTSARKMSARGLEVDVMVVAN